MSEDSDLVYSTELGKTCPRCHQPKKQCRCRKSDASAMPTDGIVRVRRETKGRKGKGMTTITGIALPIKELQQLTKQLKKKCGSGGSLKEGVIEIQGDHCDTVIQELTQRGYTVKRSGG